MFIGETVIDYKDLCIRLIGKWKKIIAFMIGFAILLGLIGALIGVVKYRQEIEYSTRTIEEIRELNKVELKKLQNNLELTERQVEEVEAAVKTYTNLQKNYNDTLSYIENSPRMQMDAANSSYLRMRYYIKGLRQAVYPVISEQDLTSDIVNAFSAEIKSNENVKKLMDILQVEVAHNYSPELIYVYTAGTDIMTIELYCGNRERCEEAAGVISDIINNSLPQIQDQFGEFEISDLGFDYFENVLNASLLSDQQEQYSYLNNIKSSLTTVSSSLSSSQKEYYEQMLDFAVEERNKLSQETEVKSNLLNIKYIVLGAVVGAFFYCLFFVLKYFTSSTLRVKTDLPDMYGVPVLSATLTKKNSKKEKGKDWVQKDINLICAEISVCMEKQGLKNVLITGTDKSDTSLDFISLLCVQMDKKGIKALYTTSISESAEAMDKLLLTDAVIMVEEIDVSMYNDIRKSVSLCKRNNIPILGSIIIG